MSQTIKMKILILQEFKQNFLLLIPTSFVCGRLVHLKRFERQHKVNKSLNYIWCMNNV